MIDFDVMFVGAGPASIIAVSELLRRGGPCRLAVIDRGPSSFERKCPGILSSSCRRCSSCNVIEGFGGAGMFSDGKLHRSHDPSAVRVFEHLESHGVPGFFPDARILEQDRELRRQLKTAGLFYHGYVSQHIGTEAIVNVTRSFEQHFRDSGVELLFSHDVLLIERKGGVFHVYCYASSGCCMNYRTRFVVISTGKGGQLELSRLVPELSSRLTSRAPAVGVRYEVPREALSLLTGNLLLDPQISYTDKGGNHISTFCTCTGGEVVAFRRNGTVMLGGRSDSTWGGSLSNFALLCVLKSAFTIDDWLDRLASRSCDVRRPLLQTLGQLSLRVAGEPELRPATTLAFYENADLNALLPPGASQLISGFIERLSRVIPSLGHPHNVLSAPVFEPRTTLDLQTEYSSIAYTGLYVVGDVTGRAGGIVASGMMGLMAADRIGPQIS